MTRVLLVADGNLLRTALAAVLSNEKDLVVAAEVTSVEVTAHLVLDTAADVAVVDVETRSAAPLDAVRTITDNCPRCGVLVLTDMAAPAGLRRVLDSKVWAFLSKECRIDDLVHATRRVAAGERFIEPGIAIAALGVPGNPLTPREVDVLRLAAEGLSPREIADALFLTGGTVRNYLSTIIRKLGARSRFDAVRLALEADWL